MRTVDAILIDRKGLKKETKVSEAVIDSGYYSLVTVIQQEPIKSANNNRIHSGSIRDVTTFKVEDIIYDAFAGLSFPITVILRETPPKPVTKPKSKVECQNHKFCKYFVKRGK